MVSFFSAHYLNELGSLMKLKRRFIYDCQCKRDKLGKKIRKFGFTLIELLVVVSIMSLLMSVMLPALTNARHSGYRVVCLSNLRQLSLGWNFFANDNDGQLVSPESSWNLNSDDLSWVCDGATGADPLNNTEAAIEMGRLWPYLENVEVYQCPGQSKIFPRSFELSRTMGGSNWTAGVNCFRNSAQISRPTDKLLFICNIHTFTIGQLRYGSFQPLESDANSVKWRDIPNPAVNEMRQSHPGGTNISYADMHVGKWRWKDSRTLRWVNSEMSSDKASPDNIDLQRLAEMMNVKWKQ